MEIENVTWVSLTARWSLEKQGKCTVSNSVLGQVIVNAENVLTLFEEVFTHCTACVRSDILKRSKLGSCSGNDDCVVHSAVLLECFNNVCNCRTLLTNSNIDTDNVLVLLVDDGIESNRSLTCLTVADNKLTLTASDRNHGVDSLDTCLQRSVYRLSCDDTGSNTLDWHHFICENGALAVDRLTERVYNSAQKLIANGNRNDFVCALYSVAFLDFSVGTEHNSTDKVLFKVKRHSVNAVLKFEQFARHTFFKTVNSGNTVADCYNSTNVGKFNLGLIILYLFLDYACNFIGA